MLLGQVKIEKKGKEAKKWSLHYLVTATMANHHRNASKGLINNINIINNIKELNINNKHYNN